MMLAAHPSVPHHHDHHNNTARWGDVAPEDVTAVIGDDDVLDDCAHAQQQQQQRSAAAPHHRAAGTTGGGIRAPPAHPSADDGPHEGGDHHPPAREEEEDEEASAEDMARMLRMKREAILLLSAARKSSSGADRIRAMTLLAALYKARTKHDMTILGEKVKELLDIKRREEAEKERIRAEEEAKKPPERFSGVRASFRRMVRSERDGRSVASEPSPYVQERKGNKWRFFWQKDAKLQARRGEASKVESTIASRMEGLEARRKIWDTRTI